LGHVGRFRLGVEKDHNRRAIVRNLERRNAGQVHDHAGNVGPVLPESNFANRFRHSRNHRPIHGQPCAGKIQHDAIRILHARGADV
jgi:hypothetical protein